MNFKFIPRQRLGDSERWLVYLFALLLVIGCKPEEQERREKYQATVNHENGRLVTVKGETFRIIYIGGVRFRFPDTTQYRWIGGAYATQPEADGIDMELFRPEIQKDKVTGEGFTRWLDGDIEKSYAPIAQVRGTTKPVETDALKSPPVPSQYQLSEEFCHDDVPLGLRVCGSKYFPKRPSIAYPLSPLKYKIYIFENFMRINFRPNVAVRVYMEGSLPLNPDWKRIYTITINLLDKYFEDNT